jgi:hypothetical protein
MFDDISVGTIFGAASTAVPIGPFLIIGGGLLGLSLSAWVFKWAGGNLLRWLVGALFFAVMFSAIDIWARGFSWQTIVVGIVAFALSIWAFEAKHFVSPAGRHAWAEKQLAKMDGKNDRKEHGN